MVDRYKERQVLRRNIWRAKVRKDKSEKRESTRAVRKLRALMKGATLADWTWLARFDELRQKIRLYSPGNCRPPSCLRRRIQ